MDPAGGRAGVRARAGERKTRQKDQGFREKEVGLLPAPESSWPQVSPPCSPGGTLSPPEPDSPRRGGDGNYQGRLKRGRGTCLMTGNKGAAAKPL